MTKSMKRMLADKERYARERAKAHYERGSKVIEKRWRDEVFGHPMIQNGEYVG